jgi:radical SAM-linked protein
MMSDNLFGYRLRFAKEGPSRFLSHHDLLRALERALRRSSLPLRMTEGFNPHPRLSLPTAIGIGVESRAEIAEIELDQWISPREVQRRLGPEFPAGTTLAQVELVSRRERARIASVTYEMAVPPGRLPSAEAIAALLARREIPIERRTDKWCKIVDIRKYLVDLRVEEGRLRARIRVTDTGTARPEEILEALGIPVTPETRFVKTETELVRR